MAVTVALLLLIGLINVSQPQPPPFDGPPFGGPPPWRPWGRRFGPWGPRGPPPFGGPPPWRRPWGRRFGPPPPLFFDGDVPPPVPPPIPPPAPPPAQPSFWPQDIQQFISNVDSRSTCFSRPGENYEAVLNVMRNHFTQKTGIQFTPTTLQVTTGQINELGPNARIANAMYETDVLLTMDQARRIAANGRGKRKVDIIANERWTTTTVPYRFSEGDSSWQNIIRTSLQDITQKTCIRFSENGQGADYILFTKGQGCYSPVGRQGGAQEVSIGSGCETAGIIVHEVSHALGLWHEQARPDRDSFVKIHTENMVTGAEPQFAKRSTSESNDFGVGYDYGSVMHYSFNTYGKSFSDKTVEPIDGLYLHTIGSRVGLSFLDAKALNLAHCSRSCSTRLACQHGGYANPNNCNSCLCPSGLEGVYCTELQRSNCGGELAQATSSWQTHTYRGAAGECYWRIRSPPGTKIRFQFTTIEFRCAPVCEEYVEVKHGYTFEKTGYRQCCKVEWGQTVSSGSEILLLSRATQSSSFVIQYIMEGQPAPAPTRPPPRPTRAPVPRATPRPQVTRRATWSSWSAWNGCTELCGACGTHSRVRSCVGSGTCSGSSRENQVCNTQACSQGTTLRGGQKRRRAFRRRHRVKRAGPWCCAGFRLVNNYCQRVNG